MLSLTALFLRWCSQVRDFGLQHLCSMRNLQILSLAGNNEALLILKIGARSTARAHTHTRIGLYSCIRVRSDDASVCIIDLKYPIIAVHWVLDDSID